MGGGGGDTGKNPQAAFTDYSHKSSGSETMRYLILFEGFHPPSCDIVNWV